MLAAGVSINPSQLHNHFLVGVLVHQREDERHWKPVRKGFGEKSRRIQVWDSIADFWLPSYPPFKRSEDLR